MRIHIKLNNKALCGQKKQKRRLQYAEHKGEATCARCIKAVEK